MTELEMIIVESVVKEIEDKYGKFNHKTNAIKKAVEELKSYTPRPVGTWVVSDNGDKIHYKCPICGKIFATIRGGARPRFCMNCGMEDIGNG